MANNGVQKANGSFDEKNNGTLSNQTIKQLPEITLKAIILSILLTVILAASNAYLSLKAGQTVSASIPAAVIALGVFRLFKNSSILESNIAQTAASAGEGLVASVTFLMPALIILKYWNNFHYLETVIISLCGGLLGVLFSIPLRRVLLADPTLKFPEGTAIGNVLKASADAKVGLKELTYGGIIGATLSFLQIGLQVVAESISFWFKAGSTIFGFGIGFNPALIAAGYIVGIDIGISLLLGTIIGWFIGIPIISTFSTMPEVLNANIAAIDIWKNHIRYLGIGTMLVGGIWTLFNMVKPILEGIRSSFASVKLIRQGGIITIPRTERDIPIHYVLGIILFLLIPIALILIYFIDPQLLNLSTGDYWGLLTVCLLYILVAGFIFASICGYIVGLVGSTNSPISAMALSALLLASLIILALFGKHFHFAAHPQQALATAAIAIIISMVVTASAVITNETIQDLKAGHMVGATPWKQQLMMIIGVVSASLVIPLILDLLFNAYGISGVFPRPGMNPAHMLSAPQAGLMAAVVQGVFAHDLPWDMIGAGCIIALFCLVIDKYLSTKGHRLPVLAVGMGIYLPLNASTAVIIGSLSAYCIEKILSRRYTQTHGTDKYLIKESQQRGLIVACGNVAGAALMGVVLAIPFALSRSTDILRIAPPNFEHTAQLLAIISTLALLLWIYRTVCRGKQ